MQTHAGMLKRFVLVYALYNMAYSAGMFLGPNCAGLILAYAGFEALMITFGIVLVACSPIMMDWKALWRWAVGSARD